MLCIIITATSAVASLHTKKYSRQLFSIPLQAEAGGWLEVAQRCRAALKKQRVSRRRVHIVLTENVIYKEFTHLPAAPKTIAGYAVLEARTVLREQAGNYVINQLNFGDFKNQNGEEASLLLATPTALLKAMQTAFGAAGFRIESIHSAFDAYKAGCERTVLPKMGDKSFVAIDFSVEHTLVNVYSLGKLASQRRLPGYASVLTPLMNSKAGETEADKISLLRSSKTPLELNEAANEALVSFLWDILRTVRVVSAPLQLDIQEFFLSGDACSHPPLKQLLKNNLELPCVFADEIDMAAIRCRNSSSSLFLAGSSLFSQTDLLSQLRTAKKNTFYDTAVCAVLAIIVLFAFMVQPFSIKLQLIYLDTASSQYQTLSPIESTLDKISEYSMKLHSIELKKQALNEYKSNVFETHPEVESLFTAEGLTLNSLSYDGQSGNYVVSFTALTKEDFLKLKDTIYANTEYYLNLNLSSTKQQSTDSYDCLLTFTPSSYKPQGAFNNVSAEPEQESVDTDIVEDFTNENQ